MKCTWRARPKPNISVLTQMPPPRPKPISIRAGGGGHWLRGSGFHVGAEAPNPDTKSNYARERETLLSLIGRKHYARDGGATSSGRGALLARGGRSISAGEGEPLG